MLGMKKKNPFLEKTFSGKKRLFSGKKRFFGKKDIFLKKRYFSGKKIFFKKKFKCYSLTYIQTLELVDVDTVRRICIGNMDMPRCQIRLFSRNGRSRGGK